MSCRANSAAPLMSSISSWTSAHTAICIGTAGASNSGSSIRLILGLRSPRLVEECGAESQYVAAMKGASDAISTLPQPACQYLLPFGARSRFLFKMDFAELEYISRLRSGVKGHFSYRKVAWEMKQALDRLDPVLGSLVKATPPSVEDPLRR